MTCFRYAFHIVLSNAYDINSLAHYAKGTTINVCLIFSDFKKYFTAC